MENVSSLFIAGLTAKKKEIGQSATTTELWREKFRGHTRQKGPKDEVHAQVQHTPFQKKKKKKKMSHFHGLAPPVNEKALLSSLQLISLYIHKTYSPTKYKASNENLRKVRHRTQSKRMENCEISNERHPLLLFVTFFYIPLPLPIV